MKTNLPRILSGLWLLPLIIAFCAFIYIWDPIPIQVIRNNAFDQFQRWQPRIYQDNTPVKIIDIDDESLKRLGQWPWPRTRIAELVSIMQNAGAAVIAFDIIFAEPDRTSPLSMMNLWQLSPQTQSLLDNLPDHDKMLAKAIANSKTVLGFALTQEQSDNSEPAVKAHYVKIGEFSLSNLHQFDGAVTSLPILESVAAGNGALTFNSDADGIVRKVPLLLTYKQSIVPSFIAEALRLAQDTRNFTIRSIPEKNAGIKEIRIGNFTIPTTSAGELWISYTPPITSRYIPAWQLLSGKTAKSDLKNKILLLGSSAQGLMDLRFSPMGGVISGIEIHAQALEQMLNKIQLNRPSWAPSFELLTIIVGGVLIGFICLHTGALFSFSTFIVTLFALWMGAWNAYSRLQLLVDPLIPSIMWVLIFILFTIIRHLYSERRQRWVKQAFSRYISPNLVDHLIAHPDTLELNGRRQYCSFVFTDLVDFTSLMEKLDPSDAVTLLNVYLDRMIEIAFYHHGTLDRIVGDSVAIMFSAPVQQFDHQNRAVNCALDMHRFAQEYRKEINAKGIAFGYTRIGIHSGEVIVGNFGGQTIFDYRALGDTVNTASRLEGANKYLGTLICVSEATLSACPNQPARPIGRIILKGKTIPVMVYEPLDGIHKEDTDLKNYFTAYELMREQKAGALKAFKELANKHPGDRLIAMHLERLYRGKTGDLIILNEK